MRWWSALIPCSLAIAIRSWPWPNSTSFRPFTIFGSTPGFTGTAITNALPLALLGLLLGGMTPLAAHVPLALVCRAVLQMELDCAFHLRKGFYWTGPLRDLVSFAVFVASFFGRGVEWRGHRYGVQADNTLAYYGEVET
jgi:hypothetical protein